MSKPRFLSSLVSLRRQSLALLVSLLLLCGFLILPGGALAADPGRPVGHIVMEFGQGSFILSAMGGKGTLTFKGRRYAFKVGGMGVGGLGVSKITAVGEVYGLKRIEDFPGAYLQAHADYAAVAGQGVQWLENSNGVVLQLRSTSKGLSLNLGADGLKIELGPIKRSKPKG
ncbi:MAG: hypothetical protein ACLGQH_10565 [Acidobacteriota bacterium]